MKRLIIAIIIPALALSCKVSEPYTSSPITDSNIIMLSRNIFDDNVAGNIKIFHNAFHIARFLEADAEEKVSEKYDLIRTGLRGSGDNYTYDYDDYGFSLDSLFGPGASWKIAPSYHRSVDVTWMSENSWRLSGNDGTRIDISFVEEGEGFISFDMDINGIKTEDSSYSAEFVSDDLRVRIEYAKIGVIGSMNFDGEMLIKFKYGSTLLKQCRMTLRPGLSESFDIF